METGVKSFMQGRDVEREQSSQTPHTAQNDVNNDAIQDLSVNYVKPRRQVLDSSTLQPISPDHSPTLPSHESSTLQIEDCATVQHVPPHANHDLPLTLPQTPASQAFKLGILNFSPPAGPQGCKFIIYLRHTSTLSAKVLTSLQSNHQSFWVDFDGYKVPAVPHVYRRYTDGKWIEREVLLCIVPEGQERVLVKLYVENERGQTEMAVEVGVFEVDEQVPLKTYSLELKGLELLDFLRANSPEEEDVMNPSMYLHSELTSDLPSHHPMNGHQNGDELVALAREAKKRKRRKSSIASRKPNEKGFTSAQPNETAVFNKHRTKSLSQSQQHPTIEQNPGSKSVVATPWTESPGQLYYEQKLSDCQLEHFCLSEDTDLPSKVLLDDDHPLPDDYIFINVSSSGNCPSEEQPIEGDVSSEGDCDTSICQIPLEVHEIANEEREGGIEESE